MLCYSFFLLHGSKLPLRQDVSLNNAYLQCFQLKATLESIYGIQSTRRVHVHFPTAGSYPARGPATGGRIVARLQKA
jgi:hypothetical protein